MCCCWFTFSFPFIVLIFHLPKRPLFAVSDSKESGHFQVHSSVDTNWHFLLCKAVSSWQKLDVKLAWMSPLFLRLNGPVAFSTIPQLEQFPFDLWDLPSTFCQSSFLTPTTLLSEPLSGEQSRVLRVLMTRRQVLTRVQAHVVVNRARHEYERTPCLMRCRTGNIPNFSSAATSRVWRGAKTIWRVSQVWLWSVN